MVKKKQEKRRLTVKQKAFVALFPQITAGAITVQEALKKAGYSDETARQQTNTVEAVRNSTVMQEELRKAGVTEQRVAQKIGKGMGNFIPQVGLGYTKLAAELLDAFPSKKLEITTPLTYKDLEAGIKAKTAEEARKMAEKEEE